MVVRAGFPRKVAGDDLLRRMSKNQPGEGGRVEGTKGSKQGDSMCKGPMVVGTEDAQGDWNRGQMMPSQQEALGDRPTVPHKSP